MYNTREKETQEENPLTKGKLIMEGIRWIICCLQIRQRTNEQAEQLYF
jgi:hypothetical protein